VHQLLDMAARLVTPINPSSSMFILFFFSCRFVCLAQEVRQRARSLDGDLSGRAGDLRLQRSTRVAGPRAICNCAQAWTNRQAPLRE